MSPTYLLAGLLAAGAVLVWGAASLAGVLDARREVAR